MNINAGTSSSSTTSPEDEIIAQFKEIDNLSTPHPSSDRLQKELSSIAELKTDLHQLECKVMNFCPKARGGHHGVVPERAFTFALYCQRFDAVLSSEEDRQNATNREKYGHVRNVQKYLKSDRPGCTIGCNTILLYRNIANVCQGSETIMLYLFDKSKEWLKRMLDNTHFITAVKQYVTGRPQYKKPLCSASSTLQEGQCESDARLEGFIRLPPAEQLLACNRSKREELKNRPLNISRTYKPAPLDSLRQALDPQTSVLSSSTSSSSSFSVSSSVSAADSPTSLSASGLALPKLIQTQIVHQSFGVVTLTAVLWLVVDQKVPGLRRLYFHQIIQVAPLQFAFEFCCLNQWFSNLEESFTVNLVPGNTKNASDSPYLPLKWHFYGHPDLAVLISDKATFINHTDVLLPLDDYGKNILDLFGSLCLFECNEVGCRFTSRRSQTQWAAKAAHISLDTWEKQEEEKLPRYRESDSDSDSDGNNVRRERRKRAKGNQRLKNNALWANLAQIVKERRVSLPADPDGRRYVDPEQGTSFEIIKRFCIHGKNYESQDSSDCWNNRILSACLSLRRLSEDTIPSLESRLCRIAAKTKLYGIDSDNSNPATTTPLVITSDLDLATLRCHMGYMFQPYCDHIDISSLEITSKCLRTTSHLTYWILNNQFNAAQQPNNPVYQRQERFNPVFWIHRGYPGSVFRIAILPEVTVQTDTDVDIDPSAFRAAVTPAAVTPTPAPVTVTPAVARAAARNEKDPSNSKGRSTVSMDINDAKDRTSNTSHQQPIRYKNTNKKPRLSSSSSVPTHQKKRQRVEEKQVRAQIIIVDHENTKCRE